MDYRPQTQPMGVAIDVSEVMRRVYVWMVGGLAITAIVAFAVAQSGFWERIENPLIVWGAFLVEIVLVIAISAGVNRMSPTMLGALFTVYSAVNGFTLSIIFLVYTGEDIAIAFVAAAAMFGAMSIVGYTTKMDLTKLGSILIMALIGLIIASVINIFFFSETLYWIINYAGVLIFTGLTAYDTQKIKHMSEQVSLQGGEAAVGRLSVWGALNLYLDFINLFLFILRIVGGSRRS